MAKNQTRRIAFGILRDDRAAFAALQGIADYAPANQTYKLETIKAAHDRMEDLQRDAIQAETMAETKRAEANAGEWDFHNAILGAKVQVEAQYGSDSNELAALGLKKKSEYKNPVRRKQMTQPTS